MFKSSRDRLAGTAESERLVEELREILSDYPDLEELEERRKEQIFKRDHEETETELWEKLIERDPAIWKNLLGDGQLETPAPKTPTDPGSFNPSFYPTTFKIIENRRIDGHEIWDEDELFQKEQSTNRRVWVYFELDAPNDYFNRDRAPGDIQIAPESMDVQAPGGVKTASLNNGVLSLRLDPLPEADPGDSMKVEVTATRELDPSLSQQFVVEYIEPESKDQDPTSSPSESKPKTNEMDKPTINPVEREMWDEFGFDEYSVVEVVSDDDQLEFNVNIDATPVRRFIDHHNISDSHIGNIIDHWKTGAALYAMGQYRELKRKSEENGMFKESEIEDLVQFSMRGVGIGMLEQHISDEELLEWSE